MRRFFTSKPQSRIRTKSFKKDLTGREAGIKAYHLRNNSGSNKNDEPDTPLKNNIYKSIDTLLSHAGLNTTTSNKASSMDGNSPLCPSLNLATTFTRPPSGDYFEDAQAGEDRWIYSRMGNPTRNLLETTMSQLEISPSKHYLSSMKESNTSRERECSFDEDKKNTKSFAFSSGMAAVSAISSAYASLHSEKSPATYVILHKDLYHGVSSLLNLLKDELKLLTPSFIDMTDLRNIQKEVQLIKKKHPKDAVINVLIWIETPSNPKCQIIDIRGICNWVQSERKSLKSQELPVQLATLVDSTWTPPCITQPLQLGSDIVLHSGTKYLAGHSDTTLGILTTSPFTEIGNLLASKIKQVQVLQGGVASPFECWLCLRGLRTLHVRVKTQSENALYLAKFLQQQQQQQQQGRDLGIIKKVYYPGLEHPTSLSHKVIHEQMNTKQVGYGGMLSLEMESEQLAMAVAGACKLIQRATSLGGTETLIEHRASIEPEGNKVSPPGLLRISVGLENKLDLENDLKEALEIAAKVCLEVER